MNGRWANPLVAEYLANYFSDFTAWCGASIDSTFEHPNCHIEFTVEKSVDFGLLRFGQSITRNSPIPIRMRFLSLQYVKNGWIQFLVDHFDKFTKQRKSCRLGNSSTADEQNLAASLCQQQSLRNSHQIFAK